MTTNATPHPAHDTTDPLRDALAAAERRLAQARAEYRLLAGHFAALEAEAIARRTPGFTGLTLDSTMEGDDEGGVFAAFCVTLELDADAHVQGLDAAASDDVDTTGLLDEDEAQDLLSEALGGAGSALLDTWGPRITRADLADFAAAATAYAATLAPAGAADITGLEEATWAVVDDLRNSYDLAMRVAGVDTAAAREIAATVADYLTNHYGTGELAPGVGGVAVDEALSFSPDAIRDHFADGGDDRAAWVAAASDQQLRDLGLAALSDDSIYRAFRGVLSALVDEAMTAKD